MKKLVRIIGGIIGGSVVVLAGLVLVGLSLLRFEMVLESKPIPAFILGGPVLVLGGLLLGGFALLLPRSPTKNLLRLVGGGALALGLVMWGIVLLFLFSAPIETLLIGGSVLVLGGLVLRRVVLLFSPIQNPVLIFGVAVLVAGVLLLGGIGRVLSGGAQIYYEGSYRGKVVDAETGAPLAGAVVLGVWKKSTGGHSSPEFYKAREVVTDVNGEFAIPGVGLRILSRIEPMDVFIFKAGYEYLDIGPWVTLQVDPLLRKEIKVEDKKAIIPLKNLTLEERKKKGAPSRPNIPREKMQRLTEEINKDRGQQGLNPL